MENHAGNLTDLAVVLAACFAGGAVLQRLKQPVLVGYILVGILLGPSVLGIVHDREQIDVLAELGILLLLFIIGLELNLEKFKPVYRVAVITSVAQIVVSLLAMAVLGWFFDWTLGRILLLGFAISLSSTAVAIKLLQDMGELNTTVGRASMGILIAQDIAVIPMLLIMNAMGGEGFNAFEAMKIFLALGLLGGVIFVLSKRQDWVCAAISAIPTHSQTSVVALAMCFSAAALAGMVGLSAAYGAFLAGLIIGNTSQSKAYEENIKPIFDVLMMIFFLSIGLLIDFEFLAQNFLQVFALLLTLMFVKTFFNIGVLRFLGISRRNAIVIGASLGQVGEFSFILAALGLASGAITGDGYRLVVALIALSLVVTPVWLYAVRRMHLLRRRGGKSAAEEGAA